MRVSVDIKQYIDFEKKLNHDYIKNKHTNIPKEGVFNKVQFILDYALFSGYLGITMEEKSLQEKYMTRSEELLKDINLLIKDINLGPSAWYGFARIGYLANLLSNKGENFGKFIGQVNEVVLQQTTIMLDHYEKENSVKVRHYDLFHGLSGIGRYLIKYKEDKTVQCVLRRLIKYLVRLCEGVEIKNINLNHYYISGENIINFHDKKELPHGYLDLGLAHGIAAPLCFLSISILEGFVVQGQKEAVKSLMSIYKTFQIEEDGLVRWPKIITFNEDGELMKSSGYNIRPSWCYGELGIARSLYIASKAIEDKETEEFSKRVVLGLTEKKIEKLGFNCPTLCHGYAGAFHILNLFYKDTGIIIFDKYAKKIMEKIDSYKNQDSIYLYKKYDFIEELGDVQEINSLSILEGTMSILMSKLSYENDIENDVFSQMLMLK